MSTEVVNVVPQAQDEVKALVRRPILRETRGVIFDAPIREKPSCATCKDCLNCVPCEVRRWPCCKCCLVFDMFPPLRESSFNRVMEGYVMWNRPMMIKKVNYQCGGFCIRKPKRKCCGLCGGIGDLWNVDDRIQVAYYDQFSEAQVESATLNHCLNECNCDQTVVLVDINHRKYACCNCLCPLEGQRIKNIHPDYTEAFVKQINDQRLATLIKLTGDADGTFFTPDIRTGALDGFSLEDSKPHEYYQATGYDEVRWLGWNAYPPPIQPPMLLQSILGKR